MTRARTTPQAPEEPPSGPLAIRYRRPRKPHRKIIGLGVTLTEEDIKRFRSLLCRDEDSGCLIFTGRLLAKGHGQFIVHGRCRESAHRVAFIIGGGVLTAEKPHVLHDCPGGDRPACCEITHLRAGSNAENARDKAIKMQGRKTLSGLPLGVWKNHRRFVAKARIGGRMRYLGSFSTWQEAAAMAVYGKNMYLFCGLEPPPCAVRRERHDSKKARQNHRRDSSLSATSG